MTVSSAAGVSTVFHTDERSRRCAAIFRRISASDRRAVAMNVTPLKRAASDCAYRLLPLRAPPSTSVTILARSMRQESSRGPSRRKRRRDRPPVCILAFSPAFFGGLIVREGDQPVIGDGNGKWKRARPRRPSTLPSKSTEPAERLVGLLTRASAGTSCLPRDG